MQKYIYEGPVMEFDVIAQSHWKGETMANSPGKARSNLAYQWKKTHGRVPTSKVTLPGKIEEV